MLQELQPSDTVVVFNLDRMGRSVLHLADLLVRFQDCGIHFCSLCEGINTTTPDGKLVCTLFSAFAEFQRDIIRENTVAGLEAAKKAANASADFGYLIPKLFWRHIRPSISRE